MNAAKLANSWRENSARNFLSWKPNDRHGIGTKEPLMSAVHLEVIPEMTFLCYWPIREYKPADFRETRASFQAHKNDDFILLNNSTILQGVKGMVDQNEAV
jgi:hypothetical protein